MSHSEVTLENKIVNYRMMAHLEITCKILRVGNGNVVFGLGLFSSVVPG